MTQSVANRYVTALTEVLEEQGSDPDPKAAYGQLEAFGALLAQSADLAAVLRSPAVSPAEKRALVAEIGTRLGMHATVRNFLHVVIDHRRIAHLDALLGCFRAWLDRRANLVEIEVRTAAPLDSGQIDELERRFRDLTGKRIRASYVVDPALLGGSSVQVGSTLYDGSLRASLGSLAATLAPGAR